MMNRKQIGILMLSIGLVLMLIASSALIIHEADHECTGENCPVCQAVAVSINVLRALGMALLFLLTFIALQQSNHIRSFCQQHDRLFSHTLVSWKIRLND